MSTHHVWVERLEGFQWAFEKKRPDVSYDRNLWGLLMMGHDGISYPFSFGIRGFPPVVSDDISAIQAEMGSLIKEASYLTRAELLKKSAELMISPDQDALKVRRLLLNLISTLPEHSGDPAGQRIVFWVQM